MISIRRPAVRILEENVSERSTASTKASQSANSFWLFFVPINSAKLCKGYNQLCKNSSHNSFHLMNLLKNLSLESSSTGVNIGPKYKRISPPDLFDLHFTWAPHNEVCTLHCTANKLKQIALPFPIYVLTIKILPIARWIMPLSISDWFLPFPQLKEY